MTLIKKISGNTYEVNGVKVTTTDYEKLPKADRAFFEKYIAALNGKMVQKSIYP